MGLSSNVLWHQTDECGFYAILKEQKLRYSYCREQIFKFSNNHQYAIPMISMSDLPFSELMGYYGKYSGYAIGIDIKWGVNNNFTPVWYCYSKSDVLSRLRLAFATIGKNNEQAAEVLFGIMSYCKLVEAPLSRKTETYLNYRFYDEREVRKCPALDLLREQSIAPYLSSDEYEEYKSSHEGKSILETGIDFSWADVKYLLVPEEEEIKKTYEIIRSKGYADDHIYVFCKKQVVQDFIGVEHNKKQREDHSLNLKGKEVATLLKILKSLAKK